MTRKGSLIFLAVAGCLVLVAGLAWSQLQQRNVTIKKATPMATPAAARTMRAPSPAEMEVLSQFGRKFGEIKDHRLMLNKDLVNAQLKVCKDGYFKNVSPGMAEAKQCIEEIKGAYLCEFDFEAQKTKVNVTGACGQGATPMAYATEAFYGCKAPKELPAAEFKCLAGYTPGPMGMIVDTDNILKYEQTKDKALLLQFLTAGYRCNVTGTILPVCRVPFGQDSPESPLSWLSSQQFLSAYKDYYAHYCCMKFEAQ